jgi:hypothetical protein
MFNTPGENGKMYFGYTREFLSATEPNGHSVVIRVDRALRISLFALITALFDRIGRIILSIGRDCLGAAMYHPDLCII